MLSFAEVKTNMQGCDLFVLSRRMTVGVKDLLIFKFSYLFWSICIEVALT